MAVDLSDHEVEFDGHHVEDGAHGKRSHLTRARPSPYDSSFLAPNEGWGRTVRSRSAGDTERPRHGRSHSDVSSLLDSMERSGSGSGGMLDPNHPNFNMQPAGFLGPPPMRAGATSPSSDLASLAYSSPFYGENNRYVSQQHGASPSGSDGAGSHSGMRPRGGSDGSATGLAVDYASKTTQATKNAAIQRRKPGTVARFKCEYCGETFTRHYNLKGHIRAHKNEKPYTCEFPGCEKAFARAHDRKRHQLLHTGEKKYKCDVCQTAFVRLDALQRHHKSENGQQCVQILQARGATFNEDGVMTRQPNADYEQAEDSGAVVVA